MGFTVKIRKLPTRASRELDKLSKRLGGPNQVRVGLPVNSNPYPDGTSVILVGAVQEFGAPSIGVPARSYLRTTVTENREKYRRAFRKVADHMVDGTLTKRQGLGQIGLLAQGDVQQKITDIDAPPLRSREGNPLVDTGHLRQSITFKVDE